MLQTAVGVSGIEARRRESARVYRVCGRQSLGASSEARLGQAVVRVVTSEQTSPCGGVRCWTRGRRPGNEPGHPGLRRGAPGTPTENAKPLFPRHHRPDLPSDLPSPTSVYRRSARRRRTVADCSTARSARCWPPAGPICPSVSAWLTRTGVGPGTEATAKS